MYVSCYCDKQRYLQIDLYEPKIDTGHQETGVIPWLNIQILIELLEFLYLQIYCKGKIEMYRHLKYFPVIVN